MPNDYTIHQNVEMYFQIIKQLSDLTLSHDSLSRESLMFQGEIDYYLKLIRSEMETLRGLGGENGL